MVKEHFFLHLWLFSWFLPSNTPIMLYNICYWSFLKIIDEQNTLHIPKCLVMLASLVAFDSFDLLLSTQLTANLTPEWSGESMFHPLLHIYAKTPFSYIETVANNALNHWHVVCEQMCTHFEHSFLIEKWWIYCLLISSTPLLSHSTSIYNRPKGVHGVFCFPGQLLNLGNLSIQHHLSLYDCILSQHTTSETLFPMKQSLNNTYQAIALPEEYFFPWFINTWNSDFSISKICNSSFT